MPAEQIAAPKDIADDSRVEIASTIKHINNILRENPETLQLSTNPMAEDAKFPLDEETQKRIAALGSDNDKERAAAGKALAKNLIPLLGSDDDKLRVKAGGQLKKLVTELKTAMNSDNLAEYEAGKRALIELSGRLVKALESDSFNVREDVSQNLVKIGHPALALVRKALNNPDQEVHDRAERICGFIETVEDKKTELFKAGCIRHLALLMLSDADREAAKAAIPALIKTLESAEDQEVKASAAEAIATIGATKEAVPQLKKSLKDPDFYVRRAAVKALVSVEAAEVLPGLIDALSDNNATVRAQAVDSIKSVGDPTAATLLGFIKLIDDKRYAEYAATKSQAIRVFEKLGPDVEKFGPEVTQKAIGTLHGALADPSALVSRDAADALAAIGPAAKEAIPDLKALAASDPHADNNSYEAKMARLAIEAAAKAIEKIEGKPKGHGDIHWENVEKRAQTLAKTDPGMAEMPDSLKPSPATTALPAGLRKNKAIQA